MATAPVGTHCILELHGCPRELLDDVLFVRDSVGQAAKHGMSTLLDLTSHKFEPQGVTAIGLLAESHLSIHTWPEHNYAAADIFTCGDDATPKQACAYLVRRFVAEDHSLVVLRRGRGIPDRLPATNVDLIGEADLCQVHS